MSSPCRRGRPMCLPVGAHSGAPLRGYGNLFAGHDTKVLSPGLLSWSCFSPVNRSFPFRASLDIAYGSQPFRWPRWLSAGNYLQKSCSELNDCDVALHKILFCRLYCGRSVSFFLLRPRESLILTMRTYNLAWKSIKKLLVRAGTSEKPVPKSKKKS